MPKRILLADDSVTVAKMVEITFAHEDFVVTAVRSGEDAVARVRAGERPDLVLVDAVMPGKSGYDTCADLRAAGLEETPVLLLAGNATPYDEGRGRSVGIDGLMIKPWDTQALIDRVNQLLARPAGFRATVDGVPPVATAPATTTKPAAEPLRATPAAAARPASPPRPTVAGPSATAQNRPPVATPAARGSLRPTVVGMPQVPPPGPSSAPTLQTLIDVEPPMLPITDTSAGAMKPGPSALPPPTLKTAVPPVAPRPLTTTRPAMVPPAPRPAPSPDKAAVATERPTQPLPGPSAKSVVEPALAKAPAAERPAPMAVPAVAVAEPTAPPAAAVESPVAKVVAPAAPSPRETRESRAALPSIPSTAPQMPRAPLIPNVPTPQRRAELARELAPRLVEKVADKVAAAAARGPEYEAIAKLSREVIEQVAWEVVPDLAEIILREIAERIVRESTTPQS